MKFGHSGEQRYSPPSWAQEVVALRHTTALFVLSGNVRDIYLDAGGHALEMPQMLRELLAGEGIVDVAMVRAAGDNTDKPEQVWEAAHNWAKAAPHNKSPIPAVPLAELAVLVRLVNEAPNRALIVFDASRAIIHPGEVTEDESAMFRDVRRSVDDQLPSPAGFNPLIWVVDAAHDVPAWFCGGNPRGRSISVPLPKAHDREVLAGRLLGFRYRDAPPLEVDLARQLLVDRTDRLPLRAVSQINTLHRTRGHALSELEDSIRVHRLGVLDNPWKDPYLAQRLRAEVDAGAEGQLRSRIRGQEAAIGKSLDVLVRSVTGLRSAQSAAVSSKPRGVLFLAGPTGVGKTELAKALTVLLFGDEAAMIRFDMSEFSATHAVERLVGAPPGYVGFSQGGELTNAVRQRPFSLLLFDEIEKADHQLLDRFLQILDDGRLTDGRGETTYFTETVIVFTSNLGIYDTQTHPMTGVVTGRRLAVDPEAGYPALVETVTGKVREHFTSVVGRPELLNRIGDNIVVFDFIQGDVAVSILTMMVDNVARAFAREYASVLTLSPRAWAVLAEQCLTPANLMMGGRGIGNLVETVLIDPLARWAFAQETIPHVEISDLTSDGRRFTVVVN